MDDDLSRSIGQKTAAPRRWNHNVGSIRALPWGDPAGRRRGWSAGFAVNPRAGRNEDGGRSGRKGRANKSRLPRKVRSEVARWKEPERGSSAVTQESGMGGGKVARWQPSQRYTPAGGRHEGSSIGIRRRVPSAAKEGRVGERQREGKTTEGRAAGVVASW
ncbi:hypothetical protein AXG93_2334s1180 [Marchantia polymorpha subsp. ruderalis]|uniref:Uncharacterized protein n=1 Tax=Marchantia polymorpha subsp. ruderalis TaxID=1480154 RepID=A0A176W4D9_MARPO|nr:hypothetical protein AXG93_2334s1180 [Marchantia polymorpha subsp. ruderalis]